MSNTPYKDELIRIATMLGLADDVDPLSVGEVVQARLDRLETAESELVTCQLAEAKHQRLTTYLASLQRDLRKAGQGAAATAIARELNK